MCTFCEFSGFTCDSKESPKPPGLHMTLQGPDLQKHHQNSTRRHPETQKKNEMAAGKGKKESEKLGGPAEVEVQCPVVWRKVVQEVPKQQTTTTTTTTTKGGVPKGFGVQKIGQNTKTLKLAKVGHDL